MGVSWEGGEGEGGSNVLVIQSVVYSYEPFLDTVAVPVSPSSHYLPKRQNQPSSLPNPIPLPSIEQIKPRDDHKAWGENQTRNQTVLKQLRAVTASAQRTPSAPSRPWAGRQLRRHEGTSRRLTQRLGSSQSGGRGGGRASCAARVLAPRGG